MKPFSALTSRARGSLIRQARQAGLLPDDRRGIVFLAPHPAELDAADGFARRIRSIDATFKESPRWYVRTGFVGKPGIHRYADGSFSIRLPLWHLPLFFAVLGLILHNKIQYLHGVWNCARGIDTLIQYLPDIFRIVDLHGAVPEESRYLGRSVPRRAILSFVERICVRRASLIIGVSNKLIEHIAGKYPGLRCRTLAIPVFSSGASAREDSAEIERLFPPDAMNLPGVIYAGSLHAWQLLPRMFAAISGRLEQARYLVLTPAPPALPPALSEALSRGGHLRLARAAPEQVAALYKFFQYGFIIREPSIVNKVACPTKLIEYLEHEIIPIMLSREIGDFAELGLRYLPLEEFERGRLLGREEFDSAVKENKRVLQRLSMMREQGLSALCAIVRERQ
ncbi:MAG: hypothetical protein LBQ63_08295 [Deltaproteobacteria bacterium]|jgi:hypothetical protein|nr:hypothetical protein [Deltaproteobacteria bacterium]